jgi:hypothetical protein
MISGAVVLPSTNAALAQAVFEHFCQRDHSDRVCRSRGRRPKETAGNGPSYVGGGDASLGLFNGIWETSPVPKWDVLK